MKEKLNEGILDQREMARGVVGADREVLYLGFHQDGHRDPQGLEPWTVGEARELRAWLDTVIPATATGDSDAK